jgi:hypothetical protein
MVFLSVELSQGRPEVCADLRHDLFAPVEHLRVEHATPVFGDEHQVDVQVMDDARAQISPPRRRGPPARWADDHRGLAS